MSKRQNSGSSKHTGKRRKESNPKVSLLSITEITPPEQCKFKLLQQIRAGLEKVPLSELTSMMKGGTPITVNSENSIYAALMILIENKILSAPVMKGVSQECIGFVDVLDLACALVEIAEKTKAYEKKTKVPDIEDENWEGKLLVDSLDAKSVTDFSQRDKFVKLNEKDSALKAAKILIDENLHRLAIVNDKEELIGVLTLSGICEYISEEHAVSMEELESTVNDLKLPKTVYTIKSTEKAIDAFRRMRETRVSGLGVVDENNNLVDAISASDLMLWTEWIAAGQPFIFPDITSLGKDIKTFLEDSRAQREISKRGPLTVELSARIVDVIGDLLIENVHRFFVVDDTNRPVSVVTFDRILDYLINN